MRGARGRQHADERRIIEIRYSSELRNRRDIRCGSRAFQRVRGQQPHAPRFHVLKNCRKSGEHERNLAAEHRWNGLRVAFVRDMQRAGVNCSMQ